MTYTLAERIRHYLKHGDAPDDAIKLDIDALEKK